MCTFSEALAEGAIKMGMPSGLAHRIVAQPLLVSEGSPSGVVCKGTGWHVSREQREGRQQAQEARIKIWDGGSGHMMKQATQWG